MREYDHVKPRDLLRWLDYVDMSETEFDRIADTFRDPRVWRQNEADLWEKDNLWGARLAYPVSMLVSERSIPPAHAAEPVPR